MSGNDHLTGDDQVDTELRAARAQVDAIVAQMPSAKRVPQFVAPDSPRRIDHRAPSLGTPGRWIPLEVPADLPRTISDQGAFLPSPLPSDIRLRTSTYRELAMAEAALGRLDEAAHRLPHRSALVRLSQLRDVRAIAAAAKVFASLPEVLTMDLPGVAPTNGDTTMKRYLTAGDTAVAGVRQGEPIDTAFLGRLSAILTDSPSGTEPAWRESPAWLGGPQPNEAFLIAAPPGPDLRIATEAWIQWTRDQCEMPLMARVALGHYQLAVLAPFTDADYLAHLYITLEFIRNDAVHDAILPISDWFLQHRDEYQRRLRGVVDHGDFDAWITFFAAGVRNTSQAQVRLIMRIQDIYEDKLSLFQREWNMTRLVAGLIGHPITNAQQLAELHDLPARQVTAVLARLQQVGIIQPTDALGIGRPRDRRRKIFACPDLLRLYSVLTE